MGKPQGIKRRIPRKPGAIVTYTDDQTARYLSMQQRLARAQELVDSIQEIPSDNPARGLYFFPSERAPAPSGGWLVTVDETRPPGGDEPQIPDPPGDPPSPGGMPPTSARTVFSAFLGQFGFEPGLPPQMTQVRGTTTYAGYPGSNVLLPWIFVQQSTPPIALSPNEAVNLIRIIAPGGNEGRSLLEIGGGYWVQSGIIHYYQTGPISITALLRYVPRPGESVPQIYQSNPGDRAYRMPVRASDPLVDDGFPPGYQAYPLGYDPTNPDPTPPPDPGDPDQPGDPPGSPPVDPGRAHYECNCPDYSRVELQDPGSDFPSRWRDRQWAESRAGCPVNVTDGKVYCKHVLAVMLHRDDPLPSFPEEGP